MISSHHFPHQNNTCCTSHTSSLSNNVHDIKRSESETRLLSIKGYSLESDRYISLTEKIQHHITNNDHWYSLEFFPPRTADGAANLLGW